MYKFISIWMLVGTIGTIVSPPEASADVWCDILAEKPTVQQAENMIIATAIAAYEKGMDATAVGRLVVNDIKNNCPEHAGIVYAGAQNVSDRVDQMGE